MKSQNAFTKKIKKAYDVRVTTNKVSSDNLRSSLEEEEFYDTNLYMKPLTTKVFEFRTKRLYFRRRVSHQNNQVIVINFEGVIGDIV